jgi:hypothetical protein
MNSNKSLQLAKFHKKKQFDDYEPEDLEISKSKINYRKSKDSSEFRCTNCSIIIGPPLSGSQQRNHCPLCLHSKHVDLVPGDRSAECGSKMEPIAIWVKREEWSILHRCMGCGVIHSNRIASDDNEMLLLSLAARPMAKPPFLI